MRLAWKYVWVALMLSLPSMLSAQGVLPAGSVLPLRLQTALKTGRIKSGDVIRARVMQNIPGSDIHQGSVVLGHVLQVSPDRIELRFETLLANGRRIPLKADLRALASAMEVEEAQLPESGPDEATPPSEWTTRQIGGEEVYRGGGPVARGITIVGEPTLNGVRGVLNSNPPCRADLEGNSNPQALWLFSTDACGVYGYPGLSIEEAGRTSPVGNIVLLSTTGKLNITSGSGLLLRIQAED
jgi:hypothetical protein